MNLLDKVRKYDILGNVGNGGNRMLGNEKNLRVIKEGDKTYVRASDAVDLYKQEYSSSGFGVPSARTLRYYCKEGILERPLKMGKESFFELNYIMQCIRLISYLQKWQLSTIKLKAVMLNVRKYDAYEDAYDLLEAVDSNFYIKAEGAGAFLSELATKDPSKVLISDVEKKMIKSASKLREELKW